MRRETTFWDMLAAIVSRWRSILFWIVLCILLATAWLLTTPLIYRAECRIMSVSQGNTSSSRALAASLGSLNSLVGGSAIPSTSDLLVGIMQGDELIDAVVDRFDLMTRYQQTSRIKIRDRIRGGILNLKTDVRSGIVSVVVLEQEPKLAADMANAFVAFLKDKLQSMSVGEAAGRRIFFEEQLAATRADLERSEDDFVRYQEASGVVTETPQAEAIVKALAGLRAQIMAKEVELSSLRTWAKKSNPALKRSEAELAALKGELAQMERRRSEDDHREGETVSSLRQLPAAGLEYQRRLRAVKYAGAMYEIMLQQWNAAKLEEAKEALRVQIIDPATPPDYKFKPKRAMILILSALLGISLGLFLALVSWAFELAAADKGQQEAMERIRTSWRRRKV